MTRAVVSLNRLCVSPTLDMTLEQALFGGAPSHVGHLALSMVANCPLARIRQQYNDCADYVTANDPGLGFANDFETRLTIYLYTFGGRVTFFPSINNPFYDPNRSPVTLANQLPITKKLIAALRIVGDADRYFRGEVFRVAKVQGQYLETVYNDFGTDRSTCLPGKVMRFLTFTSTSRDEHRAIVAGQVDMNMRFITYLIDLAGLDVGVDIADLSWNDGEREMLLIPPTSFQITDVRMDR